MTLFLLQKEKEILEDLVDEEIEETKNLMDKEFEETEAVNTEIETKLEALIDIKGALTANPIPYEVQLGIELGVLLNQYSFKEIYEFLTYKKDSCYYCDKLRNLYDKFDYKTVNEIIIQLGNQKFKEVKEDE